MSVRTAATILAGLVFAGGLNGDTVAVRHQEGLVRGFLVLRSLDGKILAGVDNFQTARGDRVTIKLVYRFRDGSFREETTVFTQSGRFRLVSNHSIQRGPAFPGSMEVWVDAQGGRVRVRYQEKNGKEKTFDETMALPADLANGMVFTLVKNLTKDVSLLEVPMVVATPKPRIVKLEIRRAGVERFSVGGASDEATRFNVHVALGGLAGLIAPIIGKQPQDSAVWVSGGTAPGFVKSEGPMFAGGPVWRTELTTPAWPR